MNIIVTAGNTIEPIDTVRNIVNSSSGKLGSMIVEKMLLTNHESINKIFYVCSRKSIIPKLAPVQLTKVSSSEEYDNIINAFNEKLTIIYADSVHETYEAMRKLLLDTSTIITHVIHSRALSDYYVHGVTSAKTIEDYVNANIAEGCNPHILMEDLSEDREGLWLDRTKKMRSTHDDLIVCLKKAPKIISLIKFWNPNVCLIGFKLLSDCTQKELIYNAIDLMNDNSCDYVIANDLSQINNIQHPAFILNSKNDDSIYCKTKMEIVEEVVRIVKEHE